MKKTISILILMVLFLIGSHSCKEKEIDKSLPPPSIKFAYDTLFIDLNKLDNPPMVGFIKSQIGLLKVDVKMKKKDASIIDEISYNEFFDRKAFSLSEEFNYSSEYTHIIVEATDIAGKVTSTELPLSIVGVKHPPVITFSTPSIDFNELIDTEMPLTKFSVTSEAGITKVEMFFATTQGQIAFSDPIEFIPPQETFGFEQQILYTVDIYGFMVKTTDIYNQIAIETLPVFYREVPMPTITIENKSVVASKNDIVDVSFEVEALAGIKTIEIFRTDNNKDLNVKSLVYGNNETNLEIREQFEVFGNTSKFVIALTDNRDRLVKANILAIIDMHYVDSLMVGTQKHSIGDASIPDVYSMLSFKDLTTYSMDYCLENAENSSNVDMKIYVHSVTQLQNRFYPIDGGNNSFSAEYFSSDGRSNTDMLVQNGTRFLLLPKNFDFDAATADLINRMSPYTITSSSVSSLVVGDVVAFKTASTSTSGGDRKGLIKIVDRKQVGPNGLYWVNVLAIKLPK